MTEQKADSQTPTPKELRSRAFRIALEMVGVFGLPAVAAILLGRWLHASFGWPEWTVYVCLAVAFVGSWIIVYIRVWRFARDLPMKSSTDSDNTGGNSDENTSHA